MYFIILFFSLFYVYYVTPYIIYNWNNNSNNNKVIDLTKACKNNTILDIFVPLEVGAADAVTLLVSKQDTAIFPQCTISFNIAREKPSDLQIIVIEYMDNKHKFDEMIEGCLGKNKIGYLTLKETDPVGKVIHVCSNFRTGKYDIPVFVHTAFAKAIVLEISATDIFHSIKITSTAGRSLRRHEYCNSTYEVQCTIGRETVCINRALSCDKNLNCGSFDENDEDYKICRVSRFAYLWIVVLAGLATLVLVFVILVYLLKTYIAQISDNFFIFNEDEDNKLVIKSQLNSHIWQNIRFGEDLPCFCQEPTDTNDSVTSD